MSRCVDELLHVHKQNSTRSTREVKIGVVHEGWEKKHPGSDEYELRNKSYWHSIDTGEKFWESFSRHLYSQYSISKDTPIVINGDGARRFVKVFITLKVLYIPMTDTI